ncbi:MAG: Capsule biosynthesis protein CapA [bacterium ADurb.Bin212]|nr:MAG: Capsule biosynthesis protein CapA [bacterium ADurb.Bin212]
MKEMKKSLFIIVILSAAIWGAYYSSHQYSLSKDAASKSDSEESGNADIPTDPPKELADRPAKISLTFAGDVMLDRNVWHNYKDVGLKKLLSDFDTSLFKDVDLSVLNLEGPISKQPIDDDWQSGSMIFNFPPESVDFLKFAGIKAVSLANNHTYNAGKNNFVYTQQVLKENNIGNFGRQIGFNETEDIYRFDGEIPVSVIGLDVLAEYIDGEIISAIKAEKANNRFVIMMPHWGVEYSQKHHSSQESVAKKWINAGADMIIGGHPHVIQDFEVIDGVPVFYSLGNFIFDQYFSPETQESLVLSAEISEEEIVVKIIPVFQTKSAPKVADGAKKESILEMLMTAESIGEAQKKGDDTIIIDRETTID